MLPSNFSVQFLCILCYLIIVFFSCLAYYDIDSEWSRIYPEFLVWLCIENSHLGYAKYTDIANCQSYPYHINHIHEKYMMKYITKPAVKVSYNLLCDNLISTLTGGFYQKNALTVSNHRIDFEILLGKDEEFIDFPSFLRNIPYDYGIMRIHGISKKDTSSPIDEEKDNDDGNKLRSSKFCLHHNVQHGKHYGICRFKSLKYSSASKRSER